MSMKPVLVVSKNQKTAVYTDSRGREIKLVAKVSGMWDPLPCTKCFLCGNPTCPKGKCFNSERKDKNEIYWIVKPELPSKLTGKTKG